MQPIVLQHGLFGYREIGLGPVRVSYFHRIDRALSDRGHPLIVPRVHPTSTIARRAAMLKRAILSHLSRADEPSKRVIIFAHSMGGLDARYMISRLGMEDRVDALVTICTPHRGSPYADWCLQHLGKRMGGLKLMNLLGLDVRAVRDLTAESCARFNEKYPDAPNVKYLSIAGHRAAHRVSPIFLHSARIVSAAEGANDGIVSVKSATWGEHLATWPVDHIHAINKRVLPEVYRKVGDMTPRYLEIVDRLSANRGMGL